MMLAQARFDPALRGHHAVYREHQTNHCPGCGRTHWLIGRVTAECAFCSTAIPLESSRNQPPLQVRKCQRCGKAKGVFAFTIVRGGKPERGYYHPPCATKAKREAEQ